MENDNVKLKIFIHPILEPVYEVFCFFIATAPMIVQKDFQKIILNSVNRFGELKPSIKSEDNVMVDMEYIFDYINRKVGLQKNEGKVEANFSNYMNSFGRIIVISLFNILENSKFNKKINGNEIYQFVRHIRNGSSHGNKFIFDSKVRKKLLNKPISWRDKKINVNLTGKEVFNSFISFIDLLFLINDLSAEINKIEKNN